MGLKPLDNIAPPTQVNSINTLDMHTTFSVSAALQWQFKQTKLSQAVIGLKNSPNFAHSSNSRVTFFFLERLSAIFYIHFSIK